MYDLLWDGPLTDQLSSAVVALAPPGGLTVDVGCGTGLVTRALVQHGHFVVGVDPNAAMLRAFAARLPATQVILGSVDDPPLRRQSVRTVVATNLLHLHPRPVRALERLVELLEPAGQLICSWPCDDAGPWQIAFAECRGGVGLGTAAARTAARIAVGLLAGPSVQRNPAHALQRSAEQIATASGLTMTLFHMPTAQQTIVVMRGTEVPHE